MGVMEAMSEASSAREEGEEGCPVRWGPRSSERKKEKNKQGSRARGWAVLSSRLSRLAACAAAQ